MVALNVSVAKKVVHFLPPPSHQCRGRLLHSRRSRHWDILKLHVLVDVILVVDKIHYQCPHLLEQIPEDYFAIKYVVVVTLGHITFDFLFSCSPVLYAVWGTFSRSI